MNSGVGSGKVTQSHLASLRGEQLSAVTFVQNYLQLEFDSKRLTINQWPSVETMDGIFQFGDVGYRNALCSLIARLVSNAYDTPDIIVIALDNGNSIRVDLASSAFRKGDRVIFHDTTNESWSWW